MQALIGRTQPSPPGPAAEVSERCELCARPIAAEHRHVVDLAARRLLCACRPCAILFDHSAAGGDHYRLVPERRRRLDDLRLDDVRWRSLGLPVEMAFFIRSSESGRVTAFYPSPAGATESTVELSSWAEMERANPALGSMQADTEALLVNGTGAMREAWLVGVDECYRLVSVVRRHWHGLSGGSEVWAEVARFFDGLRARAGRA
ncbi:MAG: DUF5947 family protein [Actinomycetota bacterium]|nr:DUF5947 family protein [Actinomycetota bacterium]